MPPCGGQSACSAMPRLPGQMASPSRHSTTQRQTCHWPDAYHKRFNSTAHSSSVICLSILLPQLPLNATGAENSSTLSPGHVVTHRPLDHRPWTRHLAVQTVPPLLTQLADGPGHAACGCTAWGLMGAVQPQRLVATGSGESVLKPPPILMPFPAHSGHARPWFNA